MKPKEILLEIKVKTDIPIEQFTKNNILILFNRAEEDTRFPEILQVQANVVKEKK